MIEITGVLAKGIKKVVLTTGITSLKLHAVYFYFTTLKIFNVSSEKINYCKTIIKYCEKGNILELLKSVEVFFDKVDVDINSFFQYSSYDFGNGLISNIISIVNDDEINNFVRIKSFMFNNYFDNTLNNASVIINLNLVIKNYNLYKDFFQKGAFLI